MSKNISILGCGWFGFPLAIRLIANGWKVKGSTTTADKVNLLSLNEIEAYLVQLQDIDAIKSREFFHSEVLLVNVPPSLKKQSETVYLDQMQGLADIVAASAISKVIFISSTSVYPELNKIINDVNEVDETSALLQSERLFTQSPAFATTVIRFGGLIGPNRDPGRWFAGKTNIPNGQAPVNLIHLDDCIALIQAILQHDKWERTYNAVAPGHPARATFYTAAAKEAGLSLPEFIDELLQWKIIDTTQITNELNYQWQYPLT